MLDSSSVGMGMGFDKVESGEQVIRLHKLGVSMANKKRKFKHLNSVQPKEAVSSRSKKHKQSKEEEEAESGYVHVRARRGQATDSHSLAERVRREKISERMKTLQSLVPACEKVGGKALMLDEIINYVQSMQNQVQFLSKKLGSFADSLKPPPPPPHQGKARESTGMVGNHNYEPMMVEASHVYHIPPGFSFRIIMEEDK